MENLFRYPFDTDKNEIKEAHPTGFFAHENYLQSKYARDFILPLGSRVLAAKKGVVVKAKHDSDGCYSGDLSGLSKEEIETLVFNYINAVAIKHENNIFTEYVHLSNKKVVSEGQEVKESELIGFTGRSGVMDKTNHLHFNAFTEKGLSIPVSFKK